MASNLKFSTALRNAMMDAITAFAGSGALIRLYTGAQPSNPQTAIGAQTLLGTLTCSSALAPAASGGVLTLNAVSSDTDADAGGTPTWFRMFKSDGTTVVMDGSVGTSDADLVLNTANIAQHSTLAISSATLTAPNG